MNALGLTEPRIFTFKDRTGNNKTERVTLSGPSTKSSVGKPRQNPNGTFTQERLYKHTTEEARKNRLFVLYGIDVQDPEQEHQVAIGHLRDLIKSHGQIGAWLWDPYLDSIDVIETLFHSPHSGSDLRGLCNAQRREAADIPQFMAARRADLDAVTGNLRGLKLEYRAAHTLQNINFHDRFLIFPKEKNQGALAWSLGTSVRDVGKLHHILQQVDDGQRVADAFEAFWKRLNFSHLIWSRL
jgi:hypothetical protein